MCVCVVYVNSKEKCVLRESGREREREYISCVRRRGGILEFLSFAGSRWNLLVCMLYV